MTPSAVDRARQGDVENMHASDEPADANFAWEDLSLTGGVLRHMRALSGFMDQLLYAVVMRQYRSLTRKHPQRVALSEHRATLYALQTRNSDASATIRHHVASARRAVLSNTVAPSDGESLKG